MIISILLFFRDMIVVVYRASNISTQSNDIETSELRSYQSNTQVSYITAYLKADVLPLTFFIGDGKEYNSEKENYFNRPLLQNTSYIVFLRFFENEVNMRYLNSSVRRITILLGAYKDCAH